MTILCTVLWGCGEDTLHTLRYRSISIVLSLLSLHVFKRCRLLVKIQIFTMTLLLSLAKNRESKKMKLQGKYYKNKQRTLEQKLDQFRFLLRTCNILLKSDGTSSEVR